MRAEDGGGGHPSMPNTTPGLTWRSDAHVLLAVHHEASHRLPVGVVGCALTYWKSAEGFFFNNARKGSRLLAAARGPCPMPKNPKDDHQWGLTTEEKIIYGSNQVAALTSSHSSGLIFSCEFGNK